VLFALLIFFVHQDRHQNDYFLIGFLLTQAAIPLHILVNYGAEFRFIALSASPDLFRVFEIAYWLEGPLLLWYTRSLIYKDFRLKTIDLLYIAPAIIYLVSMVFSFYLLSESDKFQFLENYKTEDGSLARHLSGFVRESLRVFFSVLCLVDIYRSRLQIRDRYSSLEKIDLGWLNFLVIGFTIIRVWAVFVSIAIILSVHASIPIDFSFMGLSGNYTTFLLVSALIFFSLSRSSLFEGVEEKLEPHPESSSEVSPELVKRIERHMDSQKPYLANILTLEQLANQIEVAPRTLSNVINRHFEQNFFEFINKYRVAEAKKLLQDPDKSQSTMIEIMADAGFNSKATFNTFFKKLVGTTPSQYRSQNVTD
jgi:AraC-like DNA-binding protein